MEYDFPLHDGMVAAAVSRTLALADKTPSAPLDGLVEEALGQVIRTYAMDGEDRIDDRASPMRTAMVADIMRIAEGLLARVVARPDNPSR